MSKVMLTISWIGFAIGFALTVLGYASDATGVLSTGLYIASVSSCMLAVSGTFKARSNDYIDPSGQSLQESRDIVDQFDHKNINYDHVIGN